MNFTDALVASNGTCVVGCVDIVNGQCVCVSDLHFNGSECVARNDHFQHGNGDVCSVCGEGFFINTNMG